MKQKYILLALVLLLLITIGFGGYYIYKEQQNSEPAIAWRGFSSSEPLKPGTSSEGGFILSTLQTGDESGIRTDIQIPQNADLLMFDLMFRQPGDGDWLTLSFDNVILLEFRGDIYVPGDGYLPAEVPVAHLRGKIGVLEFKMHGHGPQSDGGVSVVNLKNITIVDD